MAVEEVKGIRPGVCRCTAEEASCRLACGLQIKLKCTAWTDGPRQRALVLEYSTHISDSRYLSKTALAASHYIFSLSMLFKKMGFVFVGGGSGFNPAFCFYCLNRRFDLNN